MSPQRKSRKADDEDFDDDAYLSSLKPVPISRCPFTQESLNIAIDTSGLDNPWWDYVSPIRPADPTPSTLMVLTGALKLHGDPEHTEALVKPGPQAPFVVPALLNEKEPKAVISHLKIGKHDGYAIAYFAERVPRDLRRFNTWGTNKCWYQDEDGEWIWHSVEEDFEPLDFELGSWIEKGKLSWIAPSDKTMALRTEVEGCPYLGLEGSHLFTRIQFGQAWEPEEIPSLQQS